MQTGYLHNSLIKEYKLVRETDNCQNCFRLMKEYNRALTFPVQIIQTELQHERERNTDTVRHRILISIFTSKERLITKNELVKLANITEAELRISNTKCFSFENLRVFVLDLY
jgi:hypothetical protein